MMNNKRVQPLMDPLPQGKRVRLEGTMSTVGTSGLSKANNPPHYSQDKSLPYRHTYMSCSLSGQEPLDLLSQWSPPRMFVRNGGSPVVPSSATEGSITNPVIYRPENVSFPEDTGSPTVAEQVAVKQKLAYCTRSPSKHRPSSAGLISPVPLRKIPIGCTSLSPSTAEKSGGLAIPKPVYGHSPCCAGQRCAIGHSYTMDHGLQRRPPQMFEDDRMACYGYWPCMHKNGSEALMPQGLLPFEHCGERIPLKDVTTDGCHGLTPSKPQRVSAFSDPRQSNYMYNHLHPFVPSSPDHCQRFPMARQAHKDLVPVYDQVPGMQYETHMQIFPDCPHTSKYREIPQHSWLYCPKNNIDDYRTEKHQPTSGQRPIPQPFFKDFRNPFTMAPPGHPAVRNVPAYPAYRTHLNTRHINLFSKRPFCPPVMQHLEQPLDFSMRREQSTSSNQEETPQRLFGIKRTFHQTEAQSHYRVSNNSHRENSSLDIACQGQDSGHVNSHNYTASPTCTGDIFNKKQSICFSDQPNTVAVVSKKHRVETDKSCENDSLVKHQTIHQLKANESKHPSSPPLPIINKVFSLAPYKAYLEATGTLTSAQDPSCPITAPDSEPPKDEPKAQPADPKTILDKVGLKLKVKTEKIESDERADQSEKESHSPRINENNHSVNVKNEQGNLESTEADTKCDLVTKSGFYSSSKSVTPEMPEHPIECSNVSKVKDAPAIPAQNVEEKLFSASLSGKRSFPTEANQAKFSLNKIPPHCLKLTNFKIILPEDFKTPVSSIPEALQSPVENKSAISSRQARYQFMELHQSLCQLVSGCISQTSHCELRNWLSRLDLEKSAPPPPAKMQKVSCLLGSKTREVWMKDEGMARALQKVLCHLENYVKIQECPFPHVIRAGAVFIPMLVVKEVLFPQVQGTFIDQVLQEHRVELRPTTLSEERQLTQLHKRAFSSKLRRLLSLKHLPYIYPDVLSLLYYAGVCEVLGIEVNGTFKKECSDEAESSFNMFEVHCMSPKPHTPDAAPCLENPRRPSYQKRLRSKGRVKGTCKRRFLGDNTSSEGEQPAEGSESWTFTNCLEEESWENVPAALTGVDAHIEVKIESDAEQEPDNSWGRPLTSDDLSPESMDEDTETISLSSYARHGPGRSKKRSDMVLKLRKVYYTKGRRGRVSHYQRVPNQSEKPRGRHRHRKKKRRSSKASIRHRVRGFSSKSQHCAYLSPQRTSHHRTRWILRSAAQNTQQAMRNSYPDLVGKRIRHLYEENDKTEVWYKGVVLRIHESHPNPLKTVFEVKYDSEPEWQYYLELLLDYKKGWLQIED